MRAVIAAVVAFTATALTTAADEQPTGDAIKGIAIDKADKLGVKPGKWNEPTKVSTVEGLKKLIEDEATRTRLEKEVNLKTHDLLIFCWQGSGGDEIVYKVLESFPEQVPFSLVPGKTDDLRTHTKLFAVRKNVRWSTTK